MKELGVVEYLFQTTYYAKQHLLPTEKYKLIHLLKKMIPLSTFHTYVHDTKKKEKNEQIAHFDQRLG